MAKINNGKYYGEWTDRESVDYAAVRAMDEDDIIYAGYAYENYSGYALVVFSKGGAVFENDDVHCSCNGLDDWNPEATSIGALRMRQGWPGLHEALDAFERRREQAQSADAGRSAIGKPHLTTRVRSLCSSSCAPTQTEQPMTEGRADSPAGSGDE